MNIVQNSMKAKRELRKAVKPLRNFELVSEHLNAEITQLHAQGLKRMADASDFESVDVS
jgi:hypothetical protein